MTNLRNGHVCNLYYQLRKENRNLYEFNRVNAAQRCTDKAGPKTASSIIFMVISVRRYYATCEVKIFHYDFFAVAL